MRKSNLKAQGVLLLAPLALAACATGTNITQQQYESFEEGQTTVAEVIQVAGEPNSRQESTRGTFLFYRHGGKDKRAYIPIIGPLLFRGLDTKSCTFQFGTNDVLASKNCSTASYGR